ncbi:hypothetical protein COO60DRAFT_1096104 [Scenedesmus sp. NREL 46B-D3]|nr:hypothetical protein COO60DRAFT_1096104 [Scenedesmus sp. NREL 46B-D3]
MPAAAAEQALHTHNIILLCHCFAAPASSRPCPCLLRAHPWLCRSTTNHPLKTYDRPSICWLQDKQCSSRTMETLCNVPRVAPQHPRNVSLGFYLRPGAGSVCGFLCLLPWLQTWLQHSLPHWLCTFGLGACMDCRTSTIPSLHNSHGACAQRRNMPAAAAEQALHTHNILLLCHCFAAPASSRPCPCLLRAHPWLCRSTTNHPLKT